MHGIAQFTFEVVAPEQAVVFQVPNDRFDGIAPLQRPLEPPRINAPFLPGFVDGDVRHVNAPVTQVHKHFFGPGAAEDLGLFQAGFERMPVIGVARKTARAQHEVALVGDGDADLNTKFIFFVSLALGNALDFRGMETVKLILVLPLLSSGYAGFSPGSHQKPT